MQSLLSILFFIFAIPSVFGGPLEELPRDVIERSLAGKLTQADVPEEWKSRVSQEVKGKKTIRTFFRGERKVLEVSWYADRLEEDYSAKVYDGNEVVVNFTHFMEMTGIRAKNVRAGYQQIISIRDDGEISLGISHENGFKESIVIDGRDSNLGDDIEYMRGVIALAEFIPLVEEAGKKARRELRAKESPNKTQHHKSDRAGELED